MIKLKRVTVNKYKSIQQTQTVEIEPTVTTIVGMNESGKTNLLEVIAKTNYFVNDPDFKFDRTQDYPRNELIDFESSGEDCEIIRCDYEISDELLQLIEDELGKDVFTVKTFSYSCYYKKDTPVFFGLETNLSKFLELKVAKSVLSEETKNKIAKATNILEITEIEASEQDTDLPTFQTELLKIIEAAYEYWDNHLTGYVAKKWLSPRIPKFWYFDDYYHLEGKININELQAGGDASEKTKTAKALFELARIEPAEILNSNNYERFVALLEASSNKITNEIFKYWSSNKNLDIEFRIQDKADPQGQIHKFLDIRIKSQRHKISLPLDRRSKGFNWFFSFIIWFSKIQADKKSDYIFLLDEPGLNLHASAQADLLRFIEELAKKYQIIYTTHSPFMVESNHLDRVRTCLETEDGTIISDTIQEKDPSTLFPLQAALGYDIAQNLFISKNNLLVEGPADLIYLTVLSNILETDKRTGLKENITIIPVGGLDKVSTFISLLRGQKLNIACLLDTFNDQKGKQKVEDLIRYKIIREKNIRFFDEFANNSNSKADIEDLFDKEDYLKLFNKAFESEYSVKLKELDMKIDTIINQINKALKIERFNHYRPANKLTSLAVDKTYFTANTLDNFEKMFIEINKLFV